MESSSEWVDAVIRRLNSALPHHTQNQLWTPANDQLLQQTTTCVVSLSTQEFSSVIGSLGGLLQQLIKSHPPASAHAEVIKSYLTVLECLRKSLELCTESSLDDEDLNSLRQLEQKITMLCLLQGEHVIAIIQAANSVLYHLSGLQFHGIFNKIILRVTSLNRGSAPSTAHTSSSSLTTLYTHTTNSNTPLISTGEQPCVIGLIPHLNLDAARLRQILQVIITSFKELKNSKQKQLFLSLPPILHRSIWNFIQDYPDQFNKLLNNEYPSLERSAEKLFNLCDEYADSQRRKIQIWPLQNTILILCPRTLQDIAENGLDHPSSQYQSQRAFLSAVMKGLSNKQLAEAATICAIDQFKAGSFVKERIHSFFRFFISQIQGKLHSLLFSPSLFLHQPSSVAAGVPTFSDLDLMTTCVVAQFRTNHRNSHIFSVCLDPKSPPVFRLAFVEGLCTVLMERRMSWWPKNNAMHLYAPNLRQIFQELLPSLRRYDILSGSLPLDVKLYLHSPGAAASMLQAKKSAERKQMVEMITNYQLMRGIIRLFSLDPMLALVSPKREHLSECLIFMTGLVGLIQHQSTPQLPLMVSDVLLLLHRPEYIENWDPKDPMTAFWDISGQVTYSIALKLFSRKTTDPIQLLSWLKQILYYRTKFLQKYEVEACLGSSCKILQQMYTMLETVLLLFLRNTNTEAVQISLSCFKYLVQEAELVQNPIEGMSVPYATNLHSYRQLNDLSQHKLIGRAQQQKQNRVILKSLVHTPGSALAWEDTYSSWRATKSLLLVYQKPKEEPLQMEFSSRLSSTIRSKVTSSNSSSSKESQLTEENLQSELMNWSNMTGFLCSLAGVSTKASTYPLFLLSGGVASVNSVTDGADLAMPAFSTSQPTGYHQSPIRDPIHPVSLRPPRRSSSYSSRPKSLHNPIIRNMASSSQHSETSTNLARQGGGGGGDTVIIHDEKKPSRGSQTEAFISELMLLLKCDNEALGVQLRETVKELISNELSPPVYPYLFQCIMSESSKVFGGDGNALVQENNTTLIEQLVSIVHRVIDTKVEGALEHLVHVKMDDIVLNLIMYVNSLEQSEHTLTIQIKMCHLIETLMIKSRDLSFRAEVQFRNQVAQYLIQWLRGEVYISENISHEQNLHNELDLNVLRALSQVMHGLILQSKFSTTHILEEKEKLFLKYFEAFINLINALNSVDWSSLSPLHKQPLLRHTASLREHVVQAMSNMLTANIDSGLTHAISLGYHEDLNTRTSFIEVLTSILRQGAEFNSLADTALADRYNRMLDLITTETDDGDFPIMMALVNSVAQEHMDELAEVLVMLFDYRNKLVPFLYRIFNTEVEALESGRLDTLFRGNSIACKTLSCSFKTFGLYYLQSVVRPLILQLMKAGDIDYEVDSARLTDSSKLEQNRKNLLELVTVFYKTIQRSLPSLPLQLRTVCHVLYSVVVAHCPESSLDTVNSAIFLRFINPAIVSPQSYGLVPQGEIPNNVRRGLTFLSKVLQNLANHVLFRKEAHMVVFNKFLEENFEASRELALGMASMGPYIEGEAGEYIAFLKESYKHRIHSLLWSNHERITAYAASIRTSASSRHLFEDVNTLMAQLGAPNYRKKRTAASQRNTTMSQLEDFLDSMANECDEKTLRNVKANETFYQGGVSKLGNPVFYFIVRKLRGDQRRASNQVFYHMISLLKARTEKVFELVIDLTQSTQSNEPDLELLVKFAAYVPELTMCSIEAVYFYGANLAFKQGATKLASATRIFSHIKGSKRIVMVESLARFSEFIDPSVLALPSGTVAFEEEGKMEFSNIRFLMFKQVPLQIPATLHICGQGLVVSLVDKIKVFDIPTMLREIYHIKDIRDIFSEDKGSLVVKFADGQLLKLTSPDAETIVKEAGKNISKWQNQQPSRYMSERKLESKDVPGTFLNLALLNLGSTSASLRTSAYKLLSAVKDTFKLRIERHLESSHDLCIPRNSAEFVVSVSRELASNEPHLTLEFLSEVVAGFQQYTPAMKQLCLMYMSPWLPNLARFFVPRSDAPADHKKVSKLIDLLVALTISEQDMYPLIQTYIWSMVSCEPDLLKGFLDSFINMGLREGLRSRKVEILADSTVTLEQGVEGVVATEVIKKMLKTVAVTSEKVAASLDKHPYWARLSVLSRFLLALSFNNKVNVVKSLADILYLCVVLMAYGSVLMRATVHGIIINTLQSLASLPPVLTDEEAHKKLSLKLAEFSEPKFYMQFGISHVASVSAYPHTHQKHTSSRHGATEEDTLTAQSVMAVTEHLLDVVKSCDHLIPEVTWMSRWQRLARRTSFHYNPALQSRSFLMLGVISQKAPTILITKTLSILDETLARNDNDIVLMEAVVLCLARLVPLLDENTKLNQHLFWVAVGVLQMGDSSLFAAGLSLIEACIKRLVDIHVFESQNLAAVMQLTRDLMEWSLTQMDRELGLSFSSNFHFALAGLLYKGFSHPLSTVRTRTQELLTTLFFVHSSEGKVSAARIEVNENNLAYLTTLFPHSEIMRDQLSNQRLRLKSVSASLIERTDAQPSYSALLSTDIISEQKIQTLFLLTLASALIQTKEEAMLLLLYEFLANASEVYTEVFPLIHRVLVEHMTLMLQQCQNAQILKHVQRLVTNALSRSSSPPSVRLSFINDIGFGGLTVFFKPFPKRGMVTPTSQGTLFQKYLASLIQQLSPAEDSPNHPNNHKGSLSKISPSSSVHSTSSIKEYFSYVPPPAPHTMRKSKTTHLDHPLGETRSTSSSASSLQSTQPIVRVTRSESPKEESPPRPSFDVNHLESSEIKERDSPAELSMDELDASEVEETDL